MQSVCCPCPQLYSSLPPTCRGGLPATARLYAALLRYVAVAFRGGQLFLTLLCHRDRSGPIFSSAPYFGASGRAARILCPACCTGMERPRQPTSAHHPFAARSSPRFLLSAICSLLSSFNKKRRKLSPPPSPIRSKFSLRRFFSPRPPAVLWVPGLSQIRPDHPPATSGNHPR